MSSKSHPVLVQMGSGMVVRSKESLEVDHITHGMLSV